MMATAELVVPRSMSDLVGNLLDVALDLGIAELAAY
jgi:hypothetical protein